MKVAVVGSRGLTADALGRWEQYVPIGCSEIISGGAVGVDTLAERFARAEGLSLTVLRPDYDQFDKIAPLIRNEAIVRQADYVLILWDGRSKGTLHVIKTCMKTEKPYKLLLFKPSRER